MTFGATLYGCFWVMNRLGLPRDHRGLGYWLVRYHLGTTDEATSCLQALTRRFRIFVFAGLIGLPVVLALIGVLLTGNWTASAVLFMIAVLVAPWAVRKIRSPEPSEPESFSATGTPV